MKSPSSTTLRQTQLNFQPLRSPRFSSLPIADQTSNRKRPAHETNSPPSSKKQNMSETHPVIQDMDEEENSPRTAKLLQAIGATSSAQIAKIDELKTDVGKKFIEINRQISSVAENVQIVDAKVNSVRDDVGSLNNRINEMEQDKLGNVMDISGVSEDEINRFQKNYRRLVESIFKHFGVTYDENKIEHIRIRDIRTANKKIVVVVFKFCSDKYEAMSQKFKSTMTDRIFFEHAMTPSTRQLYHQARFAAKELKIKGPQLISGKMFLTKPNGPRIKISSSVDVENLRHEFNIPSIRTTGFRSDAATASTSGVVHQNALPQQRHFINAQQTGSPLLRFDAA